MALFTPSLLECESLAIALARFSQVLIMGDMEEGTLDKSPSIVSAHPVVFPEHHVKFREGQDNFENHNLINLQKLSPFKLQAHLGFLKLNHTYEIVIDLKVPEYIEHTQWIVSVS